MKKKHVLFNATTNVVGGGLKNSALFIQHAYKNNDVDLTCVVSNQCFSLLQNMEFRYLDELYILSESPAKSKQARKELLAIERKVSPDLVFTMAGPSYVSFESKHIMGLSNPFLTHASTHDIWQYSSLFSFVKNRLLVCYQTMWAKKADAYIFQTDEACFGAKKNFAKRKKSFVVPNAVDLEFNTVSVKTDHGSHSDIKRIFVPGGPYKHKCTHLIPGYALELKRICGNQKFKFIVCTGNSAIAEALCKRSNDAGLIDEIECIGHIDYTEMSKHYASSDVVLIPSVIETFSATYLEAFCNKKPVVAADRKHARNVCQNAAIFANPFDAYDVASRIFDIFEDKTLRRKLHANAVRVISSQVSQATRTRKIIEILQEV